MLRTGPWSWLDPQGLRPLPSWEVGWDLTQSGCSVGIPGCQLHPCHSQCWVALDKSPNVSGPWGSIRGGWFLPCLPQSWEAYTGACPPSWQNWWACPVWPFRKVWCHTGPAMPPAAPRGGLLWVIPPAPSSPEPLPRQCKNPEQHTHSQPSAGTVTCRRRWALPHVGAIRGRAEQANILSSGSQEREKMAKPQFVRSEISLKRKKGSAKVLAEEPCEGAGRCQLCQGAGKSCHLVAVWNMPATGLATCPTTIRLILARLMNAAISVYKWGDGGWESLRQ